MAKEASKLQITRTVQVGDEKPVVTSRTSMTRGGPREKQITEGLFGPEKKKKKVKVAIMKSRKILSKGKRATLQIDVSPARNIFFKS